MPYRDTSADCRLFLFHNNLNENRIFIRRSDIFPAFINNPYDISFSGKSLVDFCFLSERQKSNFTDSINSCFELTGLSLFSGGLNKSISYKIEKIGKLYHIPQEDFNKEFLPEITDKQYNDIIKLYPELNGYTFYSGVENYSDNLSGYYLIYKETSEIKIAPKSYKVHKNRFPQYDEVFEFENSGKINLDIELSYNSQEESCIITHGVKIDEKLNEKDKFQEAGYKLAYLSPVLKNRLNLKTQEHLSFDFPTRQVSRKNKIISGENKFINKNVGSPNYHNHFYMGVIPEFCFFSDTRAVIGNFGQDHLYYPNSEIISSSSYDYKEEYEDGTFYKLEKIDKIYDVVESKRFYDAIFCDAVFNSGTGFIEALQTGDSLNSNLECKQFWGPNGTFISELELGPDKINFISKTKDREVDISDIKQES